MSTPESEASGPWTEDQLHDMRAAVAPPASTVAINYIHPGVGMVGEPFAHSLALNAGALGPRLHSIASTSSADPVMSRNVAVEGILNVDPQPDWFLWWDTDMSLGRDSVVELVRLAELNDAKVATCFGVMKRPNHRDYQPWTPVPNAYYLFEKGKEDMYVMDTLPSETEPFWCDATGFGFTLIRPEVFRNFPEEHMPWHQRTEANWGVDIRFFYYAGEPVLYCPTIQAVHWKELGLDWAIWKQANDPLTSGEPN